MDRKNEIARLFSAASEVPRRAGRSPLFRWMLANADAFAAELAREGRPSWDALAVTLTEAKGLKNRDGKPLTGATVRANWYKVRLIAARLRSSAGAPPVGQDMGVRRGAKAVAPARTTKPAALPSEATPGADDQVARVKEQLNRGQEWMPEHVRKATNGKG